MHNRRICTTNYTHLADKMDVYILWCYCENLLLISYKKNTIVYSGGLCFGVVEDTVVPLNSLVRQNLGTGNTNYTMRAFLRKVLARRATIAVTKHSEVFGYCGMCSMWAEVPTSKRYISIIAQNEIASFYIIYKAISRFYECHLVTWYWHY